MQEPKNPWKEEYAGVHLVRVNEGGESFVYAALSEELAKQQHLSYLNEQGETYTEDVEKNMKSTVIDSSKPYRVEDIELYPAQWADLIHAHGCSPWLAGSSCV